MALTFKSVFNSVKKAAPIIGGAIGMASGPAGALAGMQLGRAIAGGGGGGKVQQYDAIPRDVQNLRKDTASYLQGNMGRLNQSAALADPVGYSTTQNVEGPKIGPLNTATSGTAVNDGRYTGLQGFSPTTTTSATAYTGAASAGTGRTGSIMDQLLQQRGGGDAAVRAQLMGGGGGVSAQNVRGLTEGQQSVSDLATGGFMDKFLAQYAPLFEQERTRAIAAAREGAGNLTGSGFANALGTATSRTLAEQQGRLAELAQFGIGQELGRQQNLAGLENVRNITDANNALAASTANAGNRLQGASAAGQLGNQANAQMIQALEAAGQIELANLVREQSRLTTNATTGAEVDLRNRDITSGEQGRNMGLDLQRLTALAGLQQEDAQSQAGRDQQTNLFNASEGNSRDMQVAQLAQALGLSNRQLTSQENQFLAQLLQNNNQFNAGQTNDVNNANAQRIAALLQSMTSAGVGVPQLAQQPSFLDSLMGGLTAAAPIFAGMGRPASGAPAIAPLGVRDMTPGGFTPTGPAASLPMPNLSMGMTANGAPGRPLMVDPSLGGWQAGDTRTGGPTANPMFGQTATGAMGRPATGLPPGIDPVAVAADPAGYAQWLQEKQAFDAQRGGMLGGPSVPGGGTFAGAGPAPANSFFGTTATGSMGRPAPAPSSIAGAPSSMQGLLDALRNRGMFGATGGGLTNRTPMSFLQQLPQLRAA